MGAPFGWADFSLRAKGMIVVGLPAAATVVLAGAMWVMDGSSSEAEGRVNQTLQVREEIQRLNANEVEASASVRAYLITGEDRFALQTRQSLESFDAIRQRLMELASDNPSESRLLNGLAALERTRSERIISTITRFQWGALSRDQMPALLRQKEGERLQMEAVFKEMEKEEDRLLEERLRRVNALRAGLRAISAICVFLAVTGGIGASILFSAGITSRIRKLRLNVGRLEAGEMFQPLEGGCDEIAELSEGIRKAAKPLCHLTNAFHRSVNGVAEIDAQGYYVQFNPAYAQLSGVPQSHAGLAVTDTVHPEDRSRLKEALAQAEARPMEIETRLVRPGGEIAHVAMTFVPRTEDDTEGYFLFLRDIGPRKKVEAALIEAKNDAVASNLARTQFLAKISHDIRTPLNAILGAAELLSESPLTSLQAEYVNLFQRNCTHLVDLINDFLDFSKIEAGVVRVENVPYPLRETVKEATATFHHLALKKGVTLETEIDEGLPEWVCGDALRVHQVLVNLLSNAIKFTAEGCVGVSVGKVAGPQGEWLQFAVSDTGPGIRAEDQLRIFGAFEQVDNANARIHRGCGLGLAICRELVDLMGGEIGLSSSQGSGSTFHFSLPFLAARPTEASLVASAALPLQQMSRDEVRVLVAEDTEDNQILVAEFLRDEPAVLHFVQNGLEAVDVIRRRSGDFDLVLMDLDMPVLDGLGAIKAIRAWEIEQGADPIPIVGLSAHAMNEAVRDCLDAGCAAHLPKPVSKAALVKAIWRYRRGTTHNRASRPVSDRIAALVPRYLASKLQQTEEAEARLAANDFDPIRRFGHNLKGTGSGYGLPRITDLGAEIEQSAADQDNGRVAEQLEALRQFLADDAQQGVMLGSR